MPKENLGEFEALVLLSALRLGDRAYGLSIADEIEATAERLTARAAVYVTLRRLEQKGLVTTSWESPAETDGRKPRRFVKVEAEGLRQLQRSRGALQRMWSGLEDVLEEA